MTLSELAPLISEYRSGLEAEMAILRRLQALSTEQGDITQACDLGRLAPIVEARERLMATLVTIEHGLKPVRVHLARARAQLGEVLEFQQVAAMHREAATLASSILTTDESSLDALKDAELARRIAAQTLEQGESTLAAYRRVVTPPLSPATLVNKRG